MRAPAFAVLSALGLVGAQAHAQTRASCAPHVAGGVLVSGSRGAFNARLAASAQGVAVAWAEQHPWRDRQFAQERGGESHFVARAVDRATVAPAGPARELFAQSAPYELGMGPALAAVSDGRIVSLLCTCVGGSAQTMCAQDTIVGAGAVGEIRPRPRQASACPSGPLAATGVGAHVLIGSPFPDAGGIRMYGTSVGALQDVALDEEVDAPAMAAVGTDHAVYVRRARSAIEARLFDVRGNARGRPVTLSTAGQQVGAPFALALGDAVMVAFAQRRGRAPWRIHLTTWRPGAAPTHQDVATGTPPAVAPSLAPSSGGCVVLSWTEGAGRTTVARAGRVCNGALEAASVAQLSQPGVEAGDSELASDGTSVFAVWQEIPAARGAPAELRVARLGCR